MSVERKLLQKILTAYREDKSCMSWGVANEIQELLAQPEPEPVAWFYERQIEGFTERTMSVGFEENFDGVTIPLYLAPPTRKPLSDDEISNLYYNVNGAIHKFARAIEKAHGIGVDDDR